MAKTISRRHLLHLAAVTFGGVTVSAGHTLARTTANPGRYQPSAGPPDIRQDKRPYWARSYSGGPVDVQPLPPGLPDKDYKPVAVPNGSALPFRIVDGVKVFHLIVEEVEHDFDSGLRANC